MGTKTSYPFLSQVQDPILRKALKALFDKVGTLEGQTGAIGGLSRPLDTHLDAAGNQLRKVADPTLDDDAVNLRTLRQHVSSSITQELIAAGVITAPPSAGGPGRGYGGGAGIGTPVVTPPPPTPPPPPPTPTPVPLDPPQVGDGLIQCGGKTFHYSDGTLWPWRGSTDFRLLKRYLDGEDLTTVLNNRVASGANTVRVLGMASVLFSLTPSAYANYYTQIGSFVDLVTSFGLWTEFTVFADAQIIMPAVSDQLGHFNQVINGLAGKSRLFLELANEYTLNGINPGNFLRPTGILSARASPSGGAPPYLPCWDYCPQHPSRDSEWPRRAKEMLEIRDGLEGYQAVNRPVFADEPMGAAEADVSGSRSTNADDFYQFAALSQMMSVGATFHSSDGLQSLVYEPITQNCATAFFSGLAAVPLESQLWRYTAGHLSDCPLENDPATNLRTYAKYQADGNQAIAIVIRPTGAWTAIGKNGWTISSQTGPFGALVFLTR